MTNLNHVLFGVRGDSFITVVLNAGCNINFHNVVMDVTPNTVRFYAVTDNPNVGGAYITQFNHTEINRIFSVTV